jgi:transcriptional regulator with XRE-family HTH domain
MLSKILNGFREPDERVRQRIATLLKSDETWLFERVETDAENGILPARSSTAGEKS